MAQVPYSPVPDVAPSGQGVSPLHVGVPEGAFGENIGKALGGLGRVLEHSGDELFKTAMALQEQKNAAEAMEGDAQYSLRLADIHTKFATMEGRQPSDKLMEYKDEVDKLRKEIREGLSSDAVRRQYDRHALNSMVIAVRNGASHAASQLKQYTHEQSQKSIDLTKQTVYDNPNDDSKWAEGKVEEIVRRTGADAGKSPEAIEAEVRRQVGEVTANKIDGLANEKPELAQELLNRAIAEKKLWGNEAPKLQEKIDRKLGDVTSRNIAHGIASNPAVTLEDGIQSAREQAESIKPGDPVFRDTVVQRTKGQIEENNRVKKANQQMAQETVWEGIMREGVKDVDQLLAIPGMEKAIENSGTLFKKDIQGKINRYQNAINAPINAEEFRRVSALRLNDPVAFMNLDPTSLKLNNTQMNQIAAWQKKDGKVPYDNPLVKQSMGWLREAKASQLEALGVYSRKENNKDAYDDFTGSLMAAIEIWKEQNKKPPTAKQVVDEIAPLIMRQQTVKSFGGWWNTKEAIFQKPVPDDFRKDYIANEMKTGRSDEPNEQEIKQMWSKKLLYDLYKSGATPAKPVEGAAPSSK